MRIKTPLVLLLTAGFFLAHSPAVNQREPAMEQISTNKAVMQEVSRGGKVLRMEATAYTHTGKRTSTGTVPKVGRTVAVDPLIIPYGTKLIVNGVHGYIAEDCGRDIRGHRIDVFMDSRNEALQFGRQTVRVEVKGEGE